MGLFDNASKGAGLFGSDSRGGGLFGSSAGGGGLFGGGAIEDAAATPLEQLQAENTTYTQLAKSEGISTEKPRGLLSTAVDLLSRPNYAVAGAVDALVHGQNPLARIGTELGSGLFGLQGQKKDFMDVLRENGLPAGPSVGPITTRGVIGFGLDILFDPLTYVGIGPEVKGVKVLGEAGKAVGMLHLTPEGRVLASKLAEEELPNTMQYFTKLAKMEPFSARIGTQVTLEDIQKKALNIELEAKAAAWQAAHFRILAEQQAGTLAQGILDEGGIKFFGRTIVKGEVFGRPYGEAVAKVTNFLNKSDPGRAILDGAVAMHTAVDSVFNEVNRVARKLPGYEQVRVLFRDGLHNDLGGFTETLDKLTKGMDKVTVTDENKLVQGILFRDGMKLSEYMTLHLDNPQAYPIAVVPDLWRQAALDARAIYAQFFEAEQRLGMITGSAYKEFYAPHIYKNSQDELKLLSQKFQSLGPTSKMGVFSFGPWNEERTFETLDDAVKFSRQLVADGTMKREVVPLLDLRENMFLRAKGHYTAINASDFFQNVKRMFGISAGEFNARLFETLFPNANNIVHGGLQPVLPMEAKDAIRVAQDYAALGAPSKRLGAQGQYLAQTALGKAKATLSKGVGAAAPARPGGLTPFLEDQLVFGKKTSTEVAAEIVRRQYGEKGQPQLVRQLDQQITKWLAFTPPKGKITNPEVQMVMDLLWKDVNKTGARTRASVVRTVNRLRPEAQSVFLISKMRSLRSIEDLHSFMEDFKPIIENLDPTVHGQIRTLEGNTSRQLAKGMNGERYTVMDGGRFEGYWLPESVAADIKQMPEAFLNTKSVNALVNAYDLLNDGFKLAVTTHFPSFHVRNAYSNVAQGFVSVGLSALDPRRYIQAARVMAGEDGTVVGPAIRWTYEEARQLANRLGILKDFDQIVELRSSPNSWVRRNVLKNPVSSKFAEGGSFIENNARMTLFLKHLEDGHTPEDAAMLVKKFLFDYEAISNIERNVIARAVPFYKWTKKNIALTTEQIVKNPGKYAAFAKLAHVGNSGPEADALPNYLHGDVKVKILQSPGKATFITGIDLPLNSALDLMFTGNVEDTIRQNLGMMAPAVKTLPELALQKDFFTGRDMTERAQLHAMADVIKTMPKPVRDYLEFKERIRPDGTPEYSMNGTKAYLLFRTYAQARLLTTADRLGSYRDMTQLFLDLGAGLKAKDVDLTADQEKLLRARVQMLEDRLVQHGVLKEFKRTYRPSGLQP